jgi:hypothetical protein
MLAEWNPAFANDSWASGFVDIRARCERLNGLVIPCRVARGVTPPGSHRSGRAELPHPARPVNHSHTLVGQCDPPLTTASIALRRHCVDMGSGLDVPAMFPSDGRLTRKPPSLHRLRAGRPVRRLPGYYEALRLLFTRLARLIWFVGRYLRASAVSLPGGPDATTEARGNYGSADPGRM